MIDLNRYTKAKPLELFEVLGLNRMLRPMHAIAHGWVSDGWIALRYDGVVFPNRIADERFLRMFDQSGVPVAIVGESEEYAPPTYDHTAYGSVMMDTSECAGRFDLRLPDGTTRHVCALYGPLFKRASFVVAHDDPETSQPFSRFSLLDAYGNVFAFVMALLDRLPPNGDIQ